MNEQLSNKKYTIRRNNFVVYIFGSYMRLFGDFVYYHRKNEAFANISLIVSLNSKCFAPIIL